MTSQGFGVCVLLLWFLGSVWLPETTVRIVSDVLGMWLLSQEGREDWSKYIGGSQEMRDVQISRWCSALLHSAVYRQGVKWGLTCLPLSTLASLCCSLVPSSLHISLPSSCVAVVLVSTPTFLSLKSPTIMFPVVLLPSCSWMYVRAFSSSLEHIYTCFSPLLLPFPSLYFSISPSQPLPFFLSPCLRETGM